ncbi:inositol-tetrakisphosphate 1-kinase-like [Leptonychotes weddellii]|uniref:inositol-1,3,4-trisphosphate 5/6-kinase n=1 Tax=Leptonychotes weddellii TaxID=9713 RepID=A0A7F8RHU2_LEPWE|nr:inositol-tetrakisphosphate 1-kinase-like [Leptonychotes weddellii]
MELTSLSGDDTMRLLEQNGLAFPFICKTRVAHGTNSHEMAIVFNQEGLSAIQPPCVVQNFINHNAVLYKVFVVGESYTVVQRPSLKNFSAGTSDRESIFFNSHNVSKPESSSVLTAAVLTNSIHFRPLPLGLTPPFLYWGHALAYHLLPTPPTPPGRLFMSRVWFL